MEPNDYIVTALLASEEQQYKETGNPISLIGAFTLAYRHNFPIPQWVLEKLYTFFVEHSKAKGTIPLEKIFGFSAGRGNKKSAYKAMDIYKRDFFLMLTIDKLKKVLGITSTVAAAKVATRVMRSMYENVKEPEVSKREYNETWKDFFKNTEYDPTDHLTFITTEALFNEFADRPTKRRYRNQIEELRTKIRLAPQDLHGPSFHTIRLPAFRGLGEDQESVEVHERIKKKFSDPLAYLSSLFPKE